MSFVSKTPSNDPSLQGTFAESTDISKENAPKKEIPEGKKAIDLMIEGLLSEARNIKAQGISVSLPRTNTQNSSASNIVPDLTQVKESNKKIEDSKNEASEKSTATIQAKNLVAPSKTKSEKYKLSQLDENPISALDTIKKAIREKYGKTKLWNEISHEIEGLKGDYRQYEKLQKANRSNKELIPLAQQIMARTERINLAVGALKTDSLAAKTRPESEIFFVTRGAAKKIWRRGINTKYVFITAVKSIFSRKAVEIKEEAQTAKKIRNNLFNLHLKNLFNEHFPDLEDKNKWAVSEVLIKNFDILRNLPNIAASKERKDIQIYKELKISLVQQMGNNYAAKIINLFSSGESASVKSFLSVDNYLALYFQEVVDPHYKIQGDVTYQSLWASGGNLEDALLEIRDSEGNAITNLTPEQLQQDFKKRVQYGLEILKGIGDLHRAGYVHGDLKLDNIFVYEDQDSQGNLVSKVKISDFGKTKPIKNKPLLHTGNNRDGMPVEQTLSQKGEVQSAAFLLIQVLEAHLLKNEKGMMLRNPTAVDKSKTALHRSSDIKRIGIVKFLTSNKFCPHTETTTLRCKVKLLGRLISASPKSYPYAEKEIHGYIGSIDEGIMEEDSLLKALKDAYNIDDTKLKNLEKLLKSMTSSNSSLRPTMDEAIKEYEKIGLFS